MTEVYRNSFLTIAASRAASSAHGFLDDRPQPRYVSIPIRDIGTGGLRGEAFACTILPRHAVNTGRFIHLEDEPLNKRGWALQERYLARRILHFTCSQVYFECDHDFVSEDGRECGRSNYTLEECGRKDSLFWKDWQDVVTKYSRRKLTMEDDKLPALAGLAKHFGANFGSKGESSTNSDRYLAGLWRNDIVKELCWSRERNDQPGRNPLQSYRAPTWSWASMSCGIKFDFPGMAELVVIEDAYTELDTPESPFGKVTGGLIRLRVIKIRAFGNKNSGHDPILYFDEHGVKFYLHVDWDAEYYNVPEHGKTADPVKGEIELFAIPLLWDSWVEDDDLKRVFGPCFMLVKAIANSVPAFPHLSHFERVGAGLAMCHDEHNKGFKTLIREKWTTAKESENLERIILL